MRLRGCVLAAIAVLVVAAPSAAAEIRGRVLGEDGKPVAGAAVFVRREPALSTAAPEKPVRVLTLADGSFDARGLSGSSFEVRIVADRFAPANRARVAAGGTVEVTLERGLELPGIVRDLLTRRPLEGAGVLARDPGAAGFGDEACLRATTGKDGRFVLAGLPRGHVDLEIAAPGHLLARVGPVALPRPRPAAGTQDPGIEIDADPRGRLSGRILESGARPVDGVIVRLIPVEAGAPSAPATVETASKSGPAVFAPRPVTTGREGTFAFEKLSPGAYRIESEKDGYAASGKGPIEIAAGSDLAGIELLVEREQRVLSGRVTDRTGAPVEGAEVAVFWSEGSRVRTRSARANADGRYRFEGIAGEPVDRMSAKAKGFAAAGREGAPPPNGAVNFVLDRAGGIAGRVETQGGGAPSSFRLRVRPEPASPVDEAAPDPGTVSIDPSGAFRIDDLDPGDYTLEIGAARRPAKTKTGLRVLAEQVLDVGTITLESEGGLRGRVLDARGDVPVAGASVWIESPAVAGDRLDPSVPAAGRGTSGSDGSFALVGVQPGSYVLTVEHPVFAAARVRIEFQPEQDYPELIVRLYRGGTLTGTVLDARKQPAPDVRIAIFPMTNEDVRTVATGPDGRYVAESLAPGTYQVMREPEGGVNVIGPGAKTAVVRDGETTTVDFDGLPRIMLRGRVLKGDVPLANTSILLVALGVPPPGEVRSSQTDAEGGFEIGLDHGGLYQASVRTGAPGTTGGLSTVKLAVPEQSEVQQDIVLFENSISGRITAGDGSGVKGATITAMRQGTGPADPARQSAAQTDADGGYRVDGIDPGTYRVTARAPGYRVAETYPVAVDDATPSPIVDMSLERGWFLRGRLVDPQGRGLSNAMVVVAAPGQAESGVLPTTTDATGAFKITSPSNGTLSVSAFPAGWAPAWLDNVEPPSGDDDPPVALVASPGGSLRIRVLRRGSEPAGGVQVSLQPVPLFPGWDYAASATNRVKPTDAQGNALVSLLAPGNYVLWIPGRNGVAETPVTVSEGTESEVLLSLP